MSMPQLFIVAGVVIVLGLLAYTAWLYWRLWQLRKQQKQAAELAIKAREDNIKYAKDSIAILLMGLQQEQLSMTEAAIRIAALSKVLDEQEQTQYMVFEQLAQKTSHIPILDEWKKLSSLQKAKYDDERLKLEDEFKAPVSQQLNVLLGKADAVQLFEPARQTLH